MNKRTNNSLNTISDSTSMSIFPSRDNFNKSNYNCNSSRILLEECISLIELKSSERVDKDSIESFCESAENTIREFADCDELALTLRTDQTSMCVNCFESISIDDVDMHSRLCLRPDSNSERIIDKIKMLLAQIREYKLDAREGSILALIQLEEIGKNICKGAVVRIIQELNQAFEAINKVFVNYKASSVVLVLAQRLEKLVEGLAEIPNAYKHTELSKAVISNIDSRVYSPNDPAKDSFISIMSELSFEMGSKNIKGSPGFVESQEKYFYNLCIAKKMKLDSKNPAKELPIFELYQECCDKRVPVAEWGRFIDNAFGDNFKIIITKGNKLE